MWFYLGLRLGFGLAHSQGLGSVWLRRNFGVWFDMCNSCNSFGSRVKLEFASSHIVLSQFKLMPRLDTVDSVS